MAVTGKVADDATVNGVKLHFRLEGPAGAPVVALINSLGTDLTLWDTQIGALTQRYRVLRHDTRGHGRSAAPPGPYTMEMLADDVLALLSHVGAGRFHVVGISLGGAEALAVGLRRPLGLASIAICNSRLDVPPEGAKAIDERVRLVREQGMKPLAEAMIQRWFTQAHPGGEARLSRCGPIHAAGNLDRRFRRLRRRAQTFGPRCARQRVARARAFSGRRSGYRVAGRADAANAIAGSRRAVGDHSRRRPSLEYRAAGGVRCGTACFSRSGWVN